MKESIFKEALRKLFVTFSGIVGIILGLVLIGSFIGSFSSTADITTESVYTPEIVANASGVRKVLSSDTPVILKLNINGIIGMDQLDISSMRQKLVESREDSLKDRVKAILLYINSPGGTVVDADGIYREIKAYKEQYKVPVYAFVDGLCASGGIYIASAADKIYASDVSLIGSVGVISPSFMNFSQTLDKIGVQSLTLSAGKGKDDLNPVRPWRPGEEDNYKNIIDYYYTFFIDIVTLNRPLLNKEKLVQDYGANIFPAKIAHEHGYIDRNRRKLK